MVVFCADECYFTSRVGASCGNDRTTVEERGQRWVVAARLSPLVENRNRWYDYVEVLADVKSDYGVRGITFT